MSHLNRHRPGALTALALCAALASGCATSGPTRTPARVDVQQEVGFTITESLRMSGSMRANYEEAIRLMDEGSDERGIAILEMVVEAAPASSAPRIDLAVAQQRAGNLEQAEQHLLEALKTNPGHPVAHNELGIVYRKTGRLADARRSYESALAVYPGYHVARRNLAVLCDLYLKDLDCALTNYEAYMATVHEDDEASMWMADVRMRLGQAEE